MCDVGILTFHCADNFGAMLQAYGLKTYLREHGVRADIIPYEPPFVTGRYWWIPYIPTGGLDVIIYNAWSGWKRNLKLGWAFFKRRTKIKHFSEKYLTRSGGRRFYLSRQLRKNFYQCLIVGSDQIWNPDVTLGLRKEYFGAFENKNKKKVIAYAASLGGESLDAVYDTEFSELLKSVDHISVRECAAIPYIRQFCKNDILAVLDPVFLLKKEVWQKIEKKIEDERYILVYLMERNDRLVDYVKELAKKEELSIVQIGSEVDLDESCILTNHVAGPVEFLGYIHNADYVVTNSFHGVAFSIIFQKKFTVFQHSSRGTRISNILEILKLENRLYQEDRKQEIDFHVEWNEVEKLLEKNVKLAEDYLMESLRK